MTLRQWPGMADFIGSRIPGQEEPLYLTPPINPNDRATVRFPNIPASLPVAAPMPPGPPGVEMAAPVSEARQGRLAEIAEAREVFLAGPKTSRAKSALMGALRGLGQGLATGGGLGGALGGAIAGGGFGALSPRAAMELEFTERVKPRILDRWAVEDETRALGMSAEDRALANEERRARIANMNRQNLPQPRQPTFGNAPGLGIYDQSTGQVTTPAPPREPTPRLTTFEGRTYDYNDPAQRETLTQAQSKVPRDKFGRFITRGDERANRPRAAAKPKAAAKFASITDVREYAQSKGISESQASVKFKEGGYTIVR